MNRTLFLWSLWKLSSRVDFMCAFMHQQKQLSLASANLANNNNQSIIPSTDVIQLTLTLKMTTAQVVETSVTVNNNSPIQDYVHPRTIKLNLLFDLALFHAAACTLSAQKEALCVICKPMAVPRVDVFITSEISI